MANKLPANPKQKVTWTPRLLARVRQLARAKKSARVIAEAIFTPEQRAAFLDGGRNAVIGKCRREKIQLCAQPSGTPPATRAKGASKPRVIA